MYDINGNMQPLNILQSLSQGAQLGQNATEFRQKQQKYEQDQNDQKAVRDILNGDTSAIARLQSPELIQKAQEHLRELEKRKALQGFYHPATQDQYQATVTQNPIAAIMDGNKQPSNLVEKNQQPYQAPQNMLDMIQTGKIASGQPASYDLKGAGDYLLGQGNFADAKDLAAYRLSMAKEPDEWSTPTKGINDQGKPDTYLINKRGEKKWLGSGVYEAPKDVKTSLVKTTNGFEVVRDGQLPKGQPVSENTQSAYSEIPDPNAPWAKVVNPKEREKLKATVAIKDNQKLDDLRQAVERQRLNLRDFQRFSELNNKTGSGGVNDKYNPITFNADKQEMESITSRLTPQMRPAGSGSTSDWDGKMYEKGIPRLYNSKEANEAIKTSAEKAFKIGEAELAFKENFLQQNGYLPKDSQTKEFLRNFDPSANQGNQNAWKIERVK